MLKMLGGVLIGVFVGAAVFEVLSRRSPHLLRKMENKAKNTVKAAADAFDKGYHSKADPAA